MTVGVARGFRSRWGNASEICLALAVVLGGCGQVVPPPEAPPPSVEPEAPEAADPDPDGPLLPLAEEASGNSNGGGAPSKPAPVRGADGLPDPANGIMAAGEADTFLAAGASPTVELLDAGAEPRSELRFDVPKSNADALTMTMEMRIQTPGAAAMEQPPVVMQFALSVGDKNAEDAFPVTAVLEGVTVEPKSPAQEQLAVVLRKPLSSLKGLQFTYQLTERGNHEDFSFNKAKLDGSQAQIAMGVIQSYRSTATPFPKEAVGVGAKWRVTSRHPDAGADLMQFATCELLERKGNLVKLGIATKQVAASEQVSAMGLPPGTQAKLAAFHSGGKGETLLELNRATVVSSGSAVDTSMDIKLNQNGTPISTNVDQAVKIDFARGKPKKASAANK